MKMLSKYAYLALVAPMTIVLHGCGGGGTTSPGPSPGPSPDPSPGPSPSPTPGPAPAPSPAPSPKPVVVPPRPWAPNDAVAVLNYLYMDFDENNDKSHLGVTISMASQPTLSWGENIFCAEMPTQPTECYQGQADCRLSASVFNHKVIVEDDHLAPTMSRPVGYVLNQNLTENSWAKCAYIFDGADLNKLNNGCGAGAPGNSCGDPRSAFHNQCHTEGEQSDHTHNCTREDAEISGQMCKCEPPICQESYGVVDPPTDVNGATCFYEMPALMYKDSTTTNHLRDSLKQRVANQGKNSNEWNEIVIDDRLLIPDVVANPTEAVWAFVCVPTQAADACDNAVKMRDAFQITYSVTGTIPVLALDTSAIGGPFTFPPASQIIA